ncbi:ATP-binding cassette domain-containing protein [Mucilaginibacter psychrotolerans]|uniref:ATP-binding cassette domain-containing protein n=1 Tax=Mucilaginibacter psychrotolerans TaxID=1524096 RepID=A0A4Y8S3B8_9SPHI|nr:ATP-binding cassette domain-containing protein [Mucilaginibacter psychrotolerans]TFF33276.1 ATP-binding cassette domain-containing protein [Mucilaginibacter psychrotolerans]
MHLLVSLNNVGVKFNAAQVINSLSFNVNQGGHWAITGKSGSGKSVLLQVIAGNQSISSGKIVYAFTDGDNVPAVDHHPYIAFAGARHHFKNLSNTSNLYYQQRYNSSDSEDALTAQQYLGTIKTNTHQPAYWTFEKTIQALNLQHLRDKQVIKLSNGETKRLMIAAALLKNPTLLLLDNPLTGLDVETRQYFNQLLQEVSASGITLVMATSAHEIPDVIENVAVLADGSISQSLSKAEFLANLAAQPNRPNIDTAALAALIHTNSPPNTYTEIVRMRDVVIRYGDRTILNHIDWHIAPGARWALLGANGAGKSTLLSLINGDNPQAYANDIVLFDRKRGSGESIWDIKNKIGFVSPELYQYFPTDNSCLQVIESGFYDTLGLFRPSSPAKAALALSWMKALEIDQYARVLLKNIPASAQRLCLLARALIKNPALLIFDEPCQGLDDHQQLHFKMVVDTICSISPVTLIYVTHYQHEIPDSVDRVLRLDKGEVVHS